VSRFERWNLWVTSALVVITGIGLFGVKYLMTPVEPWAVINHPVQPWLLKTHILVAPFMVFAVGSITLRHVWQHYRSGQPQGRTSGIATALVVVPMIVTGYLIQVVTSVGWLQAMVVVHLVTGTVYALALSLHQAANRSRGPSDVRPEPPRPARRPRRDSPRRGRAPDRPHATP
jgi:hypothetical protein